MFNVLLLRKYLALHVAEGSRAQALQTSPSPTIVPHRQHEISGLSCSKILERIFLVVYDSGTGVQGLGTPRLLIGRPEWGRVARDKCSDF